MNREERDGEERRERRGRRRGWRREIEQIVDQFGTDGHLSMEEDLQLSPHLEFSIDNDDAKYISGLSTIMVATIQEVKDRISQIEYIFCGQLFPKFQSRPRSLQRQFVEAMKSAEEGWRKKERELLIQIEELQHEKKKALEENQELVASLEEKAKSMSDVTNKTAEDERKREETLHKVEIEELRNEKQKALEENQILVASLQKEKATLQHNEQLLNEHQAEKKMLREKLESLQNAENEWKWHETLQQIEMDGLRDQMQKAVEENEKLFASLRKEKTMLQHNEKLLNERETEKKLLLDKLESLQTNEEVAKLQSQLKQKIEELAAGKQLQDKLFQQIEVKDIEMMHVKKKQRDLFDSYKKLKSQYNFLFNKIGLNTENSLCSNRTEEDSMLLRTPQNPKNTHGLTEENPQASGFASKMNRQKDDRNLQENPKACIVSRPIENPSSHTNKESSSASSSCPLNPPVSVKSEPHKSPTASSFHPLKLPISAKSEPRAGVKRSATTCWRDTRSRQEAGGADPHDDFLDTPLENVKGKLNKSSKEEVHDFPVPAPKDMEFESSDDETQDMNGKPVQEKQPISITKPGDRGFKYVESVRKKADRENLKGFECKQCKKFYDAVLPENGKNGEKIRCEHHDGVSRHRYKYVPPLTPEGFWNIGFESEM